ncbi:transposable element Tcb2 transposase [Trichonephila clavipes]|nr:transposable element Tcb2 transposase [Trichonephila clavipes]
MANRYPDIYLASKFPNIVSHLKKFLPKEANLIVVPLTDQVKRWDKSIKLSEEGKMMVKNAEVLVMDCTYLSELLYDLPKAKWIQTTWAGGVGTSGTNVQPTASSATIQAQVAPSLEAPVSSQTIRRHLAEGHLGSRRPLCVLPLTPTHRRLHLEWCPIRGNWTAADRNQVVFSDESRFNLGSDDNPVRVWRPHGERLNPAFALHRHTAPTAGVMVCGAIAYNTWSPLVWIRGTMTAQRYVHGILQPHVLPLMQRLPGAIFKQENARPHTARVSRDCLRTVTPLPWPAQSPDLFPIEHIWDHLGRRLGNLTSLNELEARLQQIWNEMSQDIV